MERKIRSLKEFCTKYAEILCVLILALFCCLFLFLQLGSYSLIDVDETRYVQIAREMFNSGNCVTPFLNFIPFLEKPPLYFWLSAITFEVFGEYSIFAARFANALMGTFAVFFTYFFARKALGKSFGLISALILLTSAWFLIFSHIAILDLGFMTTSAAAIYCVLLVNFCKTERNKKVCWWFCWFFMGTAVLAKGLIGVIIPFGTIFLITLFTRTLKDLFKPINLLPGIIIFLMVTIPWHYMVWAQNGQSWIDMYIIKHHFARFMDSGLGLGRKQPFLFYVPIIMIGLVPWSASFCAFLIRVLKNTVKDIKAAKTLMVIFTTDTPAQKVLVYSAIWALFGFLFFSVSSTKLPTYILTIFPALALLCGYYWWSYVIGDKFSRGIKISSYITSGLFLIAGLTALVVAFVPIETIAEYTTLAHNSILAGGILFTVISILSIIFALKNRRVLLFSSFIILMFGVITIAKLSIFPIMVQFGQSELESFAAIAKKDTQSTLTTFDFPAKYGLLNVYEKKVNYIYDDDFDALKSVTSATLGHNYIIVKNKNYEPNYKNKFQKNFETLKVGKKYTLLRK